MKYLFENPEQMVERQANNEQGKKQSQNQLMNCLKQEKRITETGLKIKTKNERTERAKSVYNFHNNCSGFEWQHRIVAKRNDLIL